MKTRKNRYSYKKYMAMILSFAILFSINSTTNIVKAESKSENASKDERIFVEVDGFLMESSQQAEMKNGQVFVVMRDIFEFLNAEIEWDPITERVTATKGTTIISLQINNNKARINDVTVDLETAPYIKKDGVTGYTMVPLRFVSESLDAYVSWDEKSRTATIDTNNIDFSMDRKIENLYVEREESKKGKKVYTFDEALRIAITDDNSIANMIDLEEQLQDRKDDLSDEYDIIMNFYGETYITMLRQLRTLDDSISDQDLQQQVIKEGMDLNLKAKVTTIDIRELQAMLLEESLLIDKKELETLELKQSLGMATELDVKEKKLAIEESEIKIETTKLAILQEYEGINEMMGLRATDKVFVEMYTPSTKRFKELDLDILIATKTDDSPNVKMKKRALEQAEYNKRVRESVGYDDTEEKEADLDRAINKADRDLKDTQKSIETTLRRDYRNLQNLEKDMETKLLEKVKIENNYKKAVANYKAGYITYREIEKLELALLSNAVENEILHKQYELQLYTIQYPYLGMGMASGE